MQVRSGTTEQKVFEVKGCATDRGGLCSLVVLGKCSKMGAFPALWWLFGKHPKSAEYETGLHEKDSTIIHKSVRGCRMYNEMWRDVVSESV